MQTLDEETRMDIGVEPKCQGQGIGQSLLLHLIEQCQLKKISHLWLEVRESNKSAIQLYDKHGFEQVDRRRNYYPTKKGTEDALLMCLYLVGDETYFQQ
jgi:ribosomal-protein-alanine N-acetyltransferase